MLFTSDMRDFIGFLEKNRVKYVLVGGFAVNYYGYVRTTQDIDILIVPSRDNAARTMKALMEFGFGNAGIPQKCFETEGTAVHLGVEPNRIDLLTHLKGVSNAEILARAQRVNCNDISLAIISLRDLICCKKNSKRAKDLADADELAKINPEHA